MRKGSIFLFSILILISLWGILFFQTKRAGIKNKGVQNTKQIQTQKGQEIDVSKQNSSENIVTYTDSDGFMPNTIIVKKGQKVIFKNKSSMEMWVASAIHPTHSQYPGSGIEKCGTTEAETIFDECEAVGKGSSWNFVFTNIGTWQYHNHARSFDTGTVIVE